MDQNIETDIIIIGGGVAGLWALNTLHQQGFKVCLLESNALGSFQTIHAQGIIHGGLKYALTGRLSSSSESIRDMPPHWAACFKGNGEINLSQTNILSKQQYLWSNGKLKSNLMAFFASKILSSRINKLTQNHYPALLQQPQFNGQVYVLKETTVETSSLVENLSRPFRDNIIHTNGDLKLNLATENHIKSLSTQTLDHTPLTIKAQAYLFTAGEQNTTLTKSLTPPLSMQTRPLHMVYVKFLNDHPTFFSHCMEGHENPQLTITTHQTHDHKTLWYCGGDLAETGIHRTSAEQIAFAKTLLKTLLPWVDLSQTQWGSFLVNRAEAKQANGKRPSKATLEKIGNAYIAWPTKLVFAPIISHELIQTLKIDQIYPRSHRALDLSQLPHPLIAKPHWEQNLA